MPIRLTVLGKSPSWQDADGACSGYLVQSGPLALLLDCGSGVFAKLRRYESYARVDAVVISHLHADHVLDLVPFAYALTYGEATGRPRPQLHVPPGSRAALRQLCGAWGSETLIEDAFELGEYDPSGTLDVLGVQLRFQLVPHYVASHAVETRDGDARLVFSADCGPNDELARFARDADLLLIESTLLDDEPIAADSRGGHLSAAQAGAIGRSAGVGRLVLTHFSDQLDAGQLRERAQAAFGGPVELAAEGASFTV